MKKLTAILTVLATMLSAAPAFACGSYTSDDLDIRAAVHRRLVHRFDDPPLTFESIDIDGDRATALVSWGDGERSEQQVYLVFEDGAWRVASFSYVVPEGTFRRIGASRRR